MGCGASKDATASAKPDEAKKKKVDDDEDDPKKRVPERRKSQTDDGNAVDPDSGSTAANVAAGVVTVAGSAAIIAGATDEGARSAMGGTAGKALLTFAKELPWIAPIAFLVGGIIAAADNVSGLKQDAKVFAKNVRAVETVLEDAAKKGTLKDVEEVCEELKWSMEEGLAHLQKLRTQYFITQLVMSWRNVAKFKEISQEMHRQLDIIAAAASISAHGMISEEFTQAEELKKTVDDMGGPDVVARDPELRARAIERLKASDALIIASVADVKDQLILEAERSRKHVEGLLSKSMAEQKVLSDQVSKLTDMMQQLLSFRAGIGPDGLPLPAPVAPVAPPPPPPPPAFDAATFEETMSAAAVRDIASRLPVFHSEPERLVAVEEAGLEDDQLDDIIGREDLVALTDAAREEFAATDAFIGSVGHKRQTMLSWTQKRPEDAVARHAPGHWMPMETTGCKHVVKKDAPLQANGGILADTMRDVDTGAPMSNLSLGEYTALAESGNEEMGAMFQNLGATMEGAAPETKLDARASAIGYQMFADGPLNGCETQHYTGMPIKLGGNTVATFCVVDSKRTRDDISLERVQAFADKARALLEKRAEERRAANAAGAA